MYLIQWIYDNGKEQFFVDKEALQIRSLEHIKEYAASMMEKLNHSFVSSIVGKIAAYEIYEGIKVTSERSQDGN